MKFKDLKNEPFVIGSTSLIVALVAIWMKFDSVVSPAFEPPELPIKAGTPVPRGSFSINGINFTTESAAHSKNLINLAGRIKAPVLADELDKHGYAAQISKSPEDGKVITQLFMKMPGDSFAKAVLKHDGKQAPELLLINDKGELAPTQLYSKMLEEMAKTAHAALPPARSGMRSL